VYETLSIPIIEEEEESRVFLFFFLGAIMILSASREFDRTRNPLIIDRESDNVELPKVCLFKRK
jgi:hypothetical protein